MIEIDGSIHDKQMQADIARQNILEELGLIVFGIKTETVEKSLPAALARIRRKIREIKQNADFSTPSVREG